MNIFYDKDFPNGASHCPQPQCGFSLYKGVLVQWDEDHDDRVLDFIDGIPDRIREQLLIIQEHKATLHMVWDGLPPSDYVAGLEFLVQGDTWNVYASQPATPYQPII